MDKVYEFLSAVRDKCLHKKAALNLQTGAQGGFLAPTEAVDAIYQQLDRLPFFKKCTLVDRDTGVGPLTKPQPPEPKAATPPAPLPSRTC